MRRKCDLITGEIYHVFTKSIAGYAVFNREQDFERFFQVLRYYQVTMPPRKFSDTCRMAKTKDLGVKQHILEITEEKSHLIQIIAYCLMPTHLHLVLKQLCDDGIETFMRKCLNSYTKYFNLLHNRKGPLWEGRFQNVRVDSDEQLIHLTRYVHLNPVTAYLKDQPEEWPASSYHEYLAKNPADRCICDFKEIIGIEPKKYEAFVKNQISCQRELAKIKKLILD